MKKVFAFVALATFMLVAGKATAQLSFNAGLGANLIDNTIKFSDGSKKDTAFAAVGFHVGLSYNVNFTEQWGIAPGIYFDYSGRSTEKLGVTRVEDMWNVDIPILFNYHRDFTERFGIIGFVGPTLRYGLSGKCVYKYSDGTPSYTFDYYKKPSGSSNSYYTRFDLGLTLGVGVHFNALQLHVGYNIGLVDRDPEKDFTTHFHQFFFGVGFVL